MTPEAALTLAGHVSAVMRQAFPLVGLPYHAGTHTDHVQLICDARQFLRGQNAWLYPYREGVGGVPYLGRVGLRYPHEQTNGPFWSWTISLHDLHRSLQGVASPSILLTDGMDSLSAWTMIARSLTRMAELERRSPAQGQTQASLVIDWRVTF